MRAKQQGVSFLGFIVIAAVVGVIGFAALKLIPVYLEYMRVQQVLSDIKTQYDGQGATIPAIKNAIIKRLEVEAVETLDSEEFKMNKKDDGIEIRAKYDRVVPYLFNISLMVSFDKAVEIRP